MKNTKTVIAIAVTIMASQMYGSSLKDRFAQRDSARAAAKRQADLDAANEATNVARDGQEFSSDVSTMLAQARSENLNLDQDIETKNIRRAQIKLQLAELNLLAAEKRKELEEAKIEEKEKISRMLNIIEAEQEAQKLKLLALAS